MRKLAAVEEAKELMLIAREWGVWRWLTDKKKVRAAADRANLALDELARKVKENWNDDLKKAYRELEAQDPETGEGYEKAKREARGIDPRVKAAAKRVKEAEEEADDAHWEAEDAFAEAEKQMSAARAREAAAVAITSWELREKAIRKAEAAGRMTGDS